ncbi:MAG TPA: 3-isopropylmalate dehydratase small subunit [Spirochaetota bacterium]|nr:3-isopropylmalate dehydratase small subunit [Spirochaetota bacterium]HNT12579.1 3-isopropylmalate dehydratase small subunit [Spirochaetota bacterium]HNV46558.1 3-isopropylmalate dehydratase small subunit [Spirochaetota bacterium]HOS38838.1 3-isopropylmalate dehydratase small subunit [Spirochaetota bacterium]HPI21901.1 3-isopropylmalate dehydratase small subunit [Spirochaetota bacterium]
MKAKGKTWKFGDDINTDEIIPARYLNTSDPNELARHCMEDADPDFMKKAAPGDIIVAGSNFGCGSSREHAPIALKAAKISCVIARSFARIFYRNSINIGFPIVESPEAADDIRPGDELEVDFDNGVIRNATSGKEYAAKPFPPFMKEIIEKGGLMNTIKSKR